MKAASIFSVALFLLISRAYSDDDLVQLSDAVGPSIVYLTTDNGNAGSGFIVGDDLVVTNYHVVENCKSLDVKFRGDAFARASGVLHLDKAKDIAVIKVVTRRELMTAMTISPELPKQGQDVAAFGNPQGYEFSVTRGIVIGIRTSEFLKPNLPVSKASAAPSVPACRRGRQPKNLVAATVEGADTSGANGYS